MTVNYHGICNVGKKRSVNQDSILLYSDEEKDLHLFIVSDGMGGHSDGEKASQAIVKAFIMWAKDADPKAIDYDFFKLIDSAQKRLDAVNYQIYKEFNQDQVCGATCVLLLIQGDNYGFISVGDSRIYKLQRHKAVQLNRDDVWENQLWVIKSLTKKQIRNHINYGKLVNAVGTDEIVEMNVETNKLSDKELFLLCSDGMYKYCSEKYLNKMLKRAEKENLEELTNEILIEVYKNGAKDNISIIYVRID